MEPFFTKTFGNPSSIHAEGVEAKKVLASSRIKVAGCIESRAEEIVFTSGGTESNNLAIFGVVASVAGSVKPHIVTTNIEHTSVLEPLRQLEKNGKAVVTYVPVEEDGTVKPEKIISAIRPSTVLVSVQYANNEIGTVQPIRKIGKALSDFCNQGLSTFNFKPSTMKNRFPIFHVDACQAPLYLRCLVNALGVDLMTLDGHKMYGPKGVGILYVRRNTPISPTLLGGGQESGLRSTTENIPLIVGFSEALRLATMDREKESKRIAGLRDNLYSNVLQNIGIKIDVNGSMKENERLPNNLNISLSGVDTEFLTLKLDVAGIAVSTMSSCLKGAKESYVVQALGGGKKRAGSTLRFTLGESTTKKDIETAAKILSTLVRSKH